MSINVRCEGCEQMLEAPEKALGRRLPCPHCATLVKVKPARRGKEVLYLDERNVLVTEGYFATPDLIYEIDDISSAAFTTEEPNPRLALIACAATFLLAWCPLSIIMSNFSWSMVLLTNLVLTSLVGLIVRLCLKPRHCVKLTTAEGAVSALSSSDKPYVRRVVKAIKTAMAHRG
jgi:hypothetical protein